MGQEQECRLHLGRRVLGGKAYLETDYLLFRGEERIRIALKEVRSVRAVEGVLKVEYGAGAVELELGAAAAKWAEKILHPPTRAFKLGIKAGLRVRVCGDFAQEFLDELSGLERAGPRGKADLVFFCAADRGGLARVAELAAGLAPAGALWVVYPKGVAEIREVEVIEAGRAAGLKDVKVVGFSATHTALKFVIPVHKQVVGQEADPTLHRPGVGGS